jgi:hypothetical protein
MTLSFNTYTARTTGDGSNHIAMGLDGASFVGKRGGRIKKGKRTRQISTGNP